MALLRNGGQSTIGKGERGASWLHNDHIDRPRRTRPRVCMVLKLGGVRGAYYMHEVRYYI